MDILTTDLLIKLSLITLSVGVAIWALRRILPAKVEKARAWKVALVLLPLVLGILIAIIPGIRPFESIAMSAASGFIAGSLSSQIYRVVRKLVPGKIKALMGSAATRGEND
jgi:hypothetical protein